jgi:membrane-bound lytic murein transglycosylase B
VLDRLDRRTRRLREARQAAQALAAADAGLAAATSGGQRIPAAYRTAYGVAAGRCPGLDWTLLAAVGQIESGHGRNPGPSSAGAIGPMQFMPATFAAYAVDGDADGTTTAWDPEDAIFTAARYLCESGLDPTPAGLRRALFAYNHADWYVDLVIAARAGIRAAT